MLQVPYKIDGLIYIPTRAEKSKEFSKAFFIWLNHMADKIRVIKAERGPDRVGEWKVSSHASGMKSIPVSENSFIPIFSWSILDFDVFQWEAFWDGNFAEYIKKFAIFEANQKLQGSRIQIADIGPENFIEEQTLFTDFLTPFENIHPGPQNQPKTAQFVKPKPNRVIKPKGHQGPKRLEETELWGAAKEAYELWDRKEINPKTKKRYTQIEAFEKFGFENIDEGKIAKYIDRIRKLKPS